MSNPKNKNVHKDLLSHYIEVGDYIAHATMAGDSAHMKISKVLGFHIGTRRWGSETEEKIVVWGVEPYQYYDMKELAWRLQCKKGFITENQRVVVLDKTRIPAEIIALLDPVTMEFSPKRCAARVAFREGPGTYRCNEFYCKEHKDGKL